MSPENRKKLNIDRSFIKDFKFVGSKIDFKKIKDAEFEDNE